MNGPTEGYTLSGVALTPPPRKLKLLPLVAATYFMVAGGPYGLEDVVQKSGYPGTICLLEFWRWWPCGSVSLDCRGRTAFQEDCPEPWRLELDPSR